MQWMPIIAGGWALAAAVVAAPAMAQNPPEAGIYSCTDAQGRRLTADRPIVACLDREQRVYGRSGVERARVGPSLTDAEREAQALQRRQQLQAEQRARDELRRQRALAYRYPDQAAHDAERAAAIAQIDDLAALAQRRAQDLRAERRKLDSEMEFYARDPARAPAALRRQLALNDESQAEQARYLAAQEQEKRRIHQRFDAELAQLRQLWAPAP
ncbi:DUF4124 domain-containing protein [Comamonas endophytica]